MKSSGDVAFTVRCVIFAIAYVIFFIALLAERYNLKRYGFVRFLFIITFVMLSSVVTAEFANHFSWPPIISNVGLIIGGASLVLMAVVILIRNKRLTGKFLPK